MYQYAVFRHSSHTQALSWRIDIYLGDCVLNNVICESLYTDSASCSLQGKAALPTVSLACIGLYNIFVNIVNSFISINKAEF